MLPAPSPLSDQPKRSSPVQPGSNPAPSRAAAAGEGVRCFRLTSSPHASAAAVCMRLSFPWQLGAAPARQRPSCRAAAELCSCRRERDAQWALQGGHGTGSCQDSAGVSTVEGRMFWTKPLKLFFFFFKKDLDFCEVNICDLCSLRFLPGEQDAAPDKYHSFCLTGCFVSPLLDAHCTETSMLSRMPRPLMCHFGAAFATLHRCFLGGLFA